MKKTEKPINWSDREHVRTLVEQRKFLWNEDYIDLLAKLIGLKPGNIIADIGCGLGYLGHTYGKFITPGGKYIGVDKNEKLLIMGSKANKSFKFIRSGAEKIPLRDESVDFAMCHTLLLHLKEPEIAIKEMIRITKKHGKVIAFEPNNFGGVCSGWNNLKETPLEELLERVEHNYRIYKGLEKLGFGDWRIGEKMPYLFKKYGLKNIEVRMNEKVHAIIPPYNTPERKKRSNEHLKSLEDFLKSTKSKRRKNLLEGKQFYLAGGGSEEGFESYIKNQEKKLGKESGEVIRMLKEESLYAAGGNFFYVTIGEK
ncbi:MAG: methyltransferase domain-containing protein [bacterium]|nr:methyltransferase domain-containing protein [bacterium]